MRSSRMASNAFVYACLSLFLVVLISLAGETSAICSGTVTAGFDPTSTLSGAFGLVATDLGTIVPIALGIAVIFWLVRKGVGMFKTGSKAVIGGSGLYLLTQGHSNASDSLFATFTAGYDPTTNITDAMGLIAGSLTTLVPIVLGIAVIFWLVRKGVGMFKTGSK